MNNIEYNQDVTKDAEGQSLLNAGLGLAEFAEMIAGGKTRLYQKEMLDALERGEKMRFDPCTGRRYYEDLYTQWREYQKVMLKPNV